MQPTAPVPDLDAPFNTGVVEPFHYSQFRLPAYRFLHGIRYHPYPRYGARKYRESWEDLNEGPFSGCTYQESDQDIQDARINERADRANNANVGDYKWPVVQVVITYAQDLARAANRMLGEVWKGNQNQNE